MIIQIDTREQLPLDFSPFGVETEESTLPVGDYGIRGLSGVEPEDLTLFAVERKKDDLASSLGKERVRFFNEIRRARAYLFFGMVIEFAKEDIENHCYRSQMNPLSILKTLVSLEVNYGVHVAFCGNAVGAAEQVHEWAHYCWARQMKQHKRLSKLTGGNT